MDIDAERACHELLLRLAGRLDDDVLWRYRDWLGEGALSTLARTLPTTLLKYRIDLDEPDYQLLVTGLLPYGADRNQVSSILGVDESPPCDYTFTSEPTARADGVDSIGALIPATLRGRPDVAEVRESWRLTGSAETREQRRVLLVTAATGHARLTGELQRVLRVLGDATPSVEVLSTDMELPRYHRTALMQSRLLCVGAVTTHGLAPA